MEEGSRGVTYTNGKKTHEAEEVDNVHRSGLPTHRILCSGAASHRVRRDRRYTPMGRRENSGRVHLALTTLHGEKRCRATACLRRRKGPTSRGLVSRLSTHLLQGGSTGGVRGALRSEYTSCVSFALFCLHASHSRGAIKPRSRGIQPPTRQARRAPTRHRPLLGSAPNCGVTARRQLDGTRRAAKQKPKRTNHVE